MREFGEETDHIGTEQSGIRPDKVEEFQQILAEHDRELARIGKLRKTC